MLRIWLLLLLLVATIYECEALYLSSSFNLDRKFATVTKRHSSSKEDDFDDFDFEAAYRERVAQVKKAEEPEQDMMKTVMIGATGAGAGFVGLAAALSALFLGIFLLGAKSPFKSVIAEPSSEVYCVFNSNCE